MRLGTIVDGCILNRQELRYKKATETKIAAEDDDDESSLPTEKIELHFEYAGAPFQVDLPPPSKILALLSEIVEGKRMMLWKDAAYQCTGAHSQRLIALTLTRLCVFQYEVWTNYCGGPYSEYKCGLG